MTPPTTTSTIKAKSRLKPKEEPHEHLQKKSISSPIILQLVFSFFQARLQFLPLFGIALICYAITLYILTYVEPHTIANLLFYHSYAPLLAAFGIATASLLSFLLLNTRRAVLITLSVIVVTSLHLQEVTLTLFTSIFIVGSFCLLEALFYFIFRK
ncbi:hypothetical protein KA082_01925 [Candidatus Woesebacteria bacterium]|nr:hypothetical protein [Candidatus Woesebacteria bacterium]